MQIWVRRDGTEDADDADVVVLAEVDGEWIEIIRERLSSNFSTCVTVEAVVEKLRSEEFEKVAGKPNSEKRRVFVQSLRDGY